MTRGVLRSLLLAWALTAVAGCRLFPVREEVDGAVCHVAARRADLQPLEHAAPAPESTLPRDGPKWEAEGAPPRSKGEVKGDRVDEDASGRPAPAERLIPPGLPGGYAREVTLPPGAKTGEEKARALEAIYPPLPELPSPRRLPPGPSGHPLTLSDLQQLAASNSPALKQAAAEVESARGRAVQAGLAPNPVVGYQADTIRQGDTAGLQGGFIDQTIKTAGKLKLARARAEQEVRLAEIAFGRARFDLLTQVRGGYFSVLSARENVRVARLLAEFTDRVYEIQVGRVRAGQAALYEPAQLRVLALQARNTLIQARNREAAAWKGLASAMGLPGMPPTELAGRIDMPAPDYCYEKALARVLHAHTDVLSARADIDRDRLGLELQRVTPIPDVNVGLVVQKDYTTPPFNIDYNVRVGLPIPVWDRNQGNIKDAQGRLERSLEEPHRVRNDLTARLAEAYERYASNRAVLDNYRRFILADQVRAFRGAYDAHQQNPDRVGFGDIVNAQQTLAAAVTTYVSTLTALWQSVVDVANLLQTEDLFQLCETFEPGAVPDLSSLPELPCCHPCSPLPGESLKRPDGGWPAPWSAEVGPALLPPPGLKQGEPGSLPMPRRAGEEAQPKGAAADDGWRRSSAR